MRGGSEDRESGAFRRSPSSMMGGGPYIWIGVALIVVFIAAVVYFKVLRPSPEAVKPIPVGQEMMAAKEEGEVFPEEEKIEAPSATTKEPSGMEAGPAAEGEKEAGLEGGTAGKPQGVEEKVAPSEEATPSQLEGRVEGLEEAPPKPEEPLTQPEMKKAEDVKVAVLPKPEETPREEPPASREISPSSEVTHPYTIHVSSHQTADVAAAQARVWRERGYAACAVPFDIEGKGKWYRVLVGRYAGAGAAKGEAERIKAEFGLDYTLVMKFPYVVEVSAYQTDQVANFEAAKLRDLGFPAYVFPDKSAGGGEVRYRLFVGAFDDPLSAISASQDLKAKGLKGSVVQP